MTPTQANTAAAPSERLRRIILPTKNSEFDNVFVLYAPTYEFSDGYHVRTDLDGGSGYYISDGKIKEIKWSRATPPTV